MSLKDRPRRRSSRAAMLALAVAAAAVLGLVTAADARAEYHLTAVGISDNGYPYEEWTDDETGHQSVWYLIDRNQWEIVDYEQGEDNPDPDGAGDEKGDAASRLALAKQADHGIIGDLITIDPQDFPFGKGQTAEGDGLVPVHYPSDFYRAYEEEMGGGGSAGGGFSGDGESFSQWLRRKAGQGGGGGSGDDGGDGSSDPPPGVIPTGEELPGPPELVNPPQREG